MTQIETREILDLAKALLCVVAAGFLIWIMFGGEPNIVHVESVHGDATFSTGGPR